MIYDDLSISLFFSKVSVSYNFFSIFIVRVIENKGVGGGEKKKKYSSLRETRGGFFDGWKSLLGL